MSITPINKVTELSFSLRDLIFVIGRGYVGGSTLKVDQNIEFNNVQYRITEVKGYETGGKYNYGVEYVQMVSGI